VVVIGLGLTGVADDERRAECGGGLGGADGGDALEEAVPLAPTAHALEQWARHVLQGEIEVRDAGGQHGLHQRVVQCRRVEVEQAGPTDPGGHCGHQLDDGPVGADGRPVEAGLDPTGRAVEGERREVLCHQDHLAEGPVGAGQLIDLIQDRVDAARPLLPAEGGDGAETAVPVAPLGDLDVRPRSG
jgi:hypothetical protein